MKLKDRTAIVTGASRGIGSAIALGLARAGADIVVNYHKDSNAAQNVTRKIEKMGRRVLAFQCDVSHREEVNQLVGSALKTFGKIDILVNNAGIFIPSLIEEVQEKDWDLVMSVNLKAVFLCCQAVGRHLITRKSGGTIINIASISAHLPEIKGGCYTPSKAGVIGLTKLLAIEWARYRIRVNAISPGPVMTPLQHKAYPSQDLLDARNRAVPLGRHGTPEEIASAAVFLASDDAAYLTGEEIAIDGGSQISMFHLVHQLATSP